MTLDHILRSERMAAETAERLDFIEKIKQAYLDGLITLEELADIL